MPSPTHVHFGFWLHRFTETARCYTCGVLFPGTYVTAEEVDRDKITCTSLPDDDPHRHHVTYTDGTRVLEGDRIRFHQAPGGLLPPAGRRDANGEYIYDWTEGVAALSGWAQDREHRARAIAVGMDPDELILRAGRSDYHLYSHVIERVGPSD